MKIIQVSNDMKVSKLFSESESEFLILGNYTGYTIVI